VDLHRLLEALATSSPEGVALADWSVHVAGTRRLTVGTKDGQTGNPHAPLTFSEGLAARYLLVWEDGRVSRGRLDRRQIESDVDDSLAAARRASYVDPDAAQVRGPATFPEVELHDAGVAAIVDGDTTVFERRHDLVRGRMTGGGFRTWSGSVRAVEGKSRLVTSAGLDVAVESTAAAWHVSFDGEWGDGYSARVVEDPDAFEGRIDRLVDTVRHLGLPEPVVQGGLHPVILHPHVVEEFVLGTLLHHVDGATVAHGEGLFSRGDFGSGRPVLREDLNLRLDPLVPLRTGSYRFTMEGVPAAPCVYIERGSLVNPILGLKYAKRLGLDPTPIPYGMDTLVLDGPEPLEIDDARGRAGGGALVLGLLGVHTQDPSSGDFSLSAPQSLALGPDGVRGRLRATISGNVFDLLRGDDLRFVRFEGERTPGLLARIRLD
jgi:PmbA protein